MKNILLLLLPMILMTCQAATAQQQQSYQNTKERESAAVSAPRVPGYYNLKDTNDLKNEYLKISQRQKKTGWFLLGGGIVTGVAGTIIARETFDLWGDENEAVGTLGVVMMLAGMGAAIGSIPSFISSARNARRAATLSINKQEILLPRHAGIARQIQPAFTVAVTLK